MGLQLSDVLDRIAAHTREHRTTLIFVNTRKMAERVAHQLAERLGSADNGDGDVDASLLVAAHHGSLSAARDGGLSRRAYGQEICAPWWPRRRWSWVSMSVRWNWSARSARPAPSGPSLQRVGRANHQRHGVPAGRLYPMTRDELVECTALLAAVHDGRLDLLEPPVAPLDVLAQQLVAEVAAVEERGVDELWEMTRCAAPYADMPRQDFDDIVALSSWGIETGAGPAGGPTFTMTRSMAACGRGAAPAWLH